MTSSKVYFGENLDVLAKIPDGTIDLVYIDPPFNTGKLQKRQNKKMLQVAGEGERTGFGGRQYITEDVGEVLSYQDSFHANYLSFLRIRLRHLHRVLKPSGSLYLHLDYREVHYAKLVGDQIFGRENFMNEIIWAYDYGGKPKNRWPAKHDNILLWAKQRGNHVFNVDDIDREPYMAPGMVTAEKAARGKLPTDCYSDDTEVLSDRGWLLFSELSSGDKLASVSPDGELFFVSPTKLHSYPYEGDMYHFKSKTLDLLVTPNHSMWACPKGHSSYGFIPARQVSNWQYISLRNKVTYRPTTESGATYTVPSVPYLRRGKPLPAFDLGDWAEFVGWYLGHSITYRDRREVCISQKKYAAELEALLTRMNLTWSKSGITYTIANKQLHSFVSSLGQLAPNKSIPREFLNLPPSYLERLLRGLMLGDGSRRLRKSTSRDEDWCYHTTSSALANQVQEIFLKLGYSSNIQVVEPKGRARLRKYVVQRRTSQESTIWRDRHIHKVSYSGMVYCATVEPYHTLVVRRSNKMAICGNCWWHTIVSPTGREKTGYPTQKPLPLLERIVRASSPPGGVVLDCFAGSGTTGEAALKLGRRFILVDSNPDACRVMKDRFAPYREAGHRIRFTKRTGEQ